MAKHIITSSTARLFAPVHHFAPGEMVEESTIEDAAQELAALKVDSIISAVESAPLHSSVAVHGLAGMPDGRIFWTSKCNQGARMRLQDRKQQNSVFATAKTEDVRRCSIRISSEEVRAAKLDELRASRDADIAERAVRFVQYAL